MIETWRDYAALPLRLVLALIFFVHGCQTLFGIFGGRGLMGTGDYLASHGLLPGEFWAVIAGLAGLFGGIALLLGVLTRLVAMALAVEMIVALVAINLHAGFAAAHGGAEFPLMVLAALLSLVLSGSQRYAVDERLPAWWTGDVPPRPSRAHA